MWWLHQKTSGFVSWGGKKINWSQNIFTQKENEKCYSQKTFWDKYGLKVKQSMLAGTKQLYNGYRKVTSVQQQKKRKEKKM